MRPALEVADIVRAHGDEFRQVHATSLSTRQKRVLRSIELCRTAALGGHLEHTTVRKMSSAFLVIDCYQGS